MKTDGNIIMKMGCMYKTIGFRIMEIGSFLIQNGYMLKDTWQNWKYNRYYFGADGVMVEQ